MDSFQERKHKNFQVESDPFLGHLWNQTLIGLTKPGRHFGLGASRHLKNTHKNPKFETGPNQGIPNQVPWLGLVSLFQIWDFCGYSLNTLKYPKMGICYFFL